MAEKEDKKEDEKLVPVGDGVESSEASEEKEEAAGEVKDEKVGHAADDEGDEEGEESDDERAKIRERRRKEKQRKAQRIASDRRELEMLRKRNEDLERRQSEIHLRQDRLEESTVDGRIGQLDAQIREAEQIHSEAVTNKDGLTATEALRVKTSLEKVRDELRDGKAERAKDREQQQQQRGNGGDQRPAVSAEAIANGRAWLKENPWFDPTLADEDSFLARAIEERIAKEGMDPRDPEYWEEFSRRVQNRMPHLNRKAKVKDDDDEREGKGGDDLDWEDDDERPVNKKPVKKPGGPRIAVGGKTRTLKPNEVYLSAERVKALKDAGVWDDDEKRERYLKAYQKYDKDAAARNS